MITSIIAHAEAVTANGLSKQHLGSRNPPNTGRLATGSIDFVDVLFNYLKVFSTH